MYTLAPALQNSCEHSQSPLGDLLLASIWLRLSSASKHNIRSVTISVLPWILVWNIQWYKDKTLISSLKIMEDLMQGKADLLMCNMPNPTFIFLVHLMLFWGIKWAIPYVIFCRKDKEQSSFIRFILEVNIQKRDQKLLKYPSREIGSAYNNEAGIA